VRKYTGALYGGATTSIGITLGMNQKSQDEDLDVLCGSNQFFRERAQNRKQIAP